jgi:hypothetical protein
MEKQDFTGQDVKLAAFSREELEQHLRARAWKDDTFRQELLANPKVVLQRDFAALFPEGKIPSELSIKVVEEEEQSICFVLPTKTPKDTLPDTETLEDEELSNPEDVSGASYVWGTCHTCHAAATCYTCSCQTKCACNSRSLLSKIRL